MICEYNVRARNRTLTHDDSSLGAAICPGIREVLESLCSVGERVVALRRDIYNVNGRWTYLYRAVDKQGRRLDFLLTEKPDVAAAKRFFEMAMNGNGTPRVITLDAYAASHRAIRELKAEGKISKRVRIRSSKDLNDGVEQDHRRVKQRIRPMPGFQGFQTTAVTIAGIELAAKIRSTNSRLEN